MGYNLLVNRVHWGYNPLILTFDPNFQVCLGVKRWRFPDVKGENWQNGIQDEFGKWLYVGDFMALPPPIKPTLRDQLT